MQRAPTPVLPTPLSPAACPVRGVVAQVVMVVMVVLGLGAAALINRPGSTMGRPWASASLHS